MIEFYLECNHLLKHACLLACFKKVPDTQGKCVGISSVILVSQNQLIVTNSKEKEKKGFHFRRITVSKVWKKGLRKAIQSLILHEEFYLERLNVDQTPDFPPR